MALGTDGLNRKSEKKKDENVIYDDYTFNPASFSTVYTIFLRLCCPLFRCAHAPLVNMPESAASITNNTKKRKRRLNASSVYLFMRATRIFIYLLLLLVSHFFFLARKTWACLSMFCFLLHFPFRFFFFSFFFLCVHFFVAERISTAQLIINTQNTHAHTTWTNINMLYMRKKPVRLYYYA